MFNALCNKITHGMLWTIIISFAILILVISILIGAYASVVWKSDQVSYEGSLGKFSAKASHLQEQLRSALDTNEKLIETVSQLRKKLDDLKTNYTSSHLKFSNDKFKDLSTSLDNQKKLLHIQKEKLKVVSDDILQFKQNLEDQSKKHYQHK